jgi:hypothetical protein
MREPGSRSQTKCPDLIEWLEWTIVLCKKGDKPYIPSYPELHQFCKSNNHGRCPNLKTQSVLTSKVCTEWSQEVDLS